MDQQRTNGGETHPSRRHGRSPIMEVKRPRVEEISKPVNKQLRRPIFVPIIRVSRDTIPLAWLDVTYAFAENSENTYGGRIFTNYSDSLADWFRGEDKSAKAVQIVRDKTSGRLCAVEKVRYGEYAMCAIGSWVPEELVIGKKTIVQKQETQVIDISSAQKSVVPSKDKPAMDRWWEAAAIKDTSTTLEVETEVVAIQPDQSIGLPMSQETSNKNNPSTAIKQPALFTPSKVLDGGSSNTQDPESPQPPMSPDQLHESFLLQYLAALYLQRTSLAFFAKGPLTKARLASATKTKSSHEDLSVRDLTKFLRTMILDLKVVDKKYKDRLPSIARDTAFGVIDDEGQKAIRKPRKPKKLKIKPNKEGLYSCEEEYVRNWWCVDEEQLFSSAENREQLVKRRIQLLKTREILLQIVLVLEILSLEASAEWKQESRAVDLVQAADTKETSQNAEETQNVEVLPVQARKERRLRNLVEHLGMLVSMVLIWQAAGSEAESTSLQSSSGIAATRGWGLDVLGEFCIDVITPFFKNRLPDDIAPIVEQLGGSSNSPEKSLKTSARDKMKDVKKTFGNEVTKVEKTSSRRGLHRTPTEVDPPTAVKRVPGLVRAATDTSLLCRNGVKRESSEGPINLSTIPFLREQKKPRKDSAEKLRLMQKRTVSLSDIGPAKKRKAVDQEELRAAIENIKRPNRGEAGRVVFEEREKRATKALAGQKQDSRKILNSRTNIQVAATPKNHRKVDVFRRESQLSHPVVVVQEAETIPSTGAASRILDTVKRASTRDSITETPSVHRVKKLDLFAGSHSRSGSGSLQLGEAIGSASTASELLAATNNTVFATPVRPTQRRSNSDIEPRTPSSTHAKAQTAPFVSEVRGEVVLSQPHPQMTATANPQKSVPASPGNIYAALGWDDFPIDE